jgi:DNA-binding NtrC family response regulator
LAIKIPPLRERREDIPFLCEDLITKLRPKLGLRYVPALDRGAMKTLLEYHWPGNIRELRNVLERALITCDSHHITKKHVFIEETPEEQTGDTMTFTFKLSQEFPFTTQLENVKVDVITRALAAQRGNISATARLLGVSRDVLRHSIKTLGIDPRRLG